MDITAGGQNASHLAALGGRYVTLGGLCGDSGDWRLPSWFGVFFLAYLVVNATLVFAVVLSEFHVVKVT